jgi:hypothetical protein
MKVRLTSSLVGILAGMAVVVIGAGSAVAHDKHKREEVVRARLTSIQEVPAVTTPASGFFKAVIDDEAGTIEYTISYENLQGAVTQSHIHVGQVGVNGGISVFLCSNLGNGPAGTQTCPPAPAEISGTIAMTDVIGPAGQGVTAGDFADLLRAIRSGVAYANVHTDQFPGGETRGQIR